MQVNVAVFQCRRGAEEAEDAVCRVAGDGPAQDLPAIVQVAEQKAAGIGAVGGDDDDQFVGVSLGRVLQNLVLLWTLVGVSFVGDDDVAVEGVLLVGVRGKGVDRDHAVTNVTGNGPLHVVVDDTQPLVWIVPDCYAEAVEVVFEKVKTFERLFQGAANLIDFRAGGTLIHG